MPKERVFFPIRFEPADIDKIRRAAKKSYMSINSYVCLAAVTAAEKVIKEGAPPARRGKTQREKAAA